MAKSRQIKDFSTTELVMELSKRGYFEKTRFYLTGNHCVNCGYEKILYFPDNSDDSEELFNEILKMEPPNISDDNNPCIKCGCTHFRTKWDI